MTLERTEPKAESSLDLLKPYRSQGGMQGLIGLDDVGIAADHTSIVLVPQVEQRRREMSEGRPYGS